MTVNRRDVLGYAALGVTAIATASAYSFMGMEESMTATAIKNTATDWRALLGRTLAEEHIYQPSVTGKIPDGLNGFLYRNGPGRFDRGDARKPNLLDGDGMIQSFQINEGKVTYRNKFVRTHKLETEEKAGTFVYETWTDRAPGGFLKNLGKPDIKSQAGVTPVYRHDKLYAFDEVESPYVLDGESLDTVGPEKIGSVIKNFKAHTKIDAGNGDWILFGTEFGAKMKAQIIVQGKDGTIKSQFSEELPRTAYMHDFFVTENYVILNLQPAGLNLIPLMAGLRSFSDALSWEADKGNLLVILDKNGSEKPIIIEAPTAWMWHSYNAYEQGDMIIADFIGYEEPDHFLGKKAAFKTIMNGEIGLSESKGRPRRYEINLKNKSVKQSILLDGSYEFPIIHSEKCCHAHSVGYASMGVENSIFHSAISKLDFKSGTSSHYDFGAHIHIGEPVFAADPNHPADENKGWLMVIGLEGTTGMSFMAILAAEDVAAGPVATVHLTHHTPLSFHGFWRQV